MVNNQEGKANQPDLPADRREQKRKIVPGDQQFPVIIGDPDSTYSIIRKEARHKLHLEIKAHVLSSQDVYCQIRDISEKGLCIISMVKLEPKQKVGVFFQIPDWYIQQDIGITLICEVIWHQPNAAENGMAHFTGLVVTSSTDDELYKNFISRLPSLEKAHV
ncbi:MAG: PilZ domain-containing protein [Candidatus Parcubacteria bacterium]|nr:PilZ domain-containing protein [Candidatus Parcubacteria bacterium]